MTTAERDAIDGLFHACEWSTATLATTLRAMNSQRLIFDSPDACDLHRYMAVLDASLALDNAITLMQRIEQLVAKLRDVAEGFEARA